MLVQGGIDHHAQVPGSCQNCPSDEARPYIYFPKYILPEFYLREVCSRIGSGAAKPILPELIPKLEYSGIQISGRDASRQSYKVPYISDCARSNGVAVVDSYDALLAEYRRDEQMFWNYWVDHPTAEVRHNGHMSKAGNAFIADLIAPVIANHLKN